MHAFTRFYDWAIHSINRQGYTYFIWHHRGGNLGSEKELLIWCGGSSNIEVGDRSVVLRSFMVKPCPPRTPRRYLRYIPQIPVGLLQAVITLNGKIAENLLGCPIGDCWPNCLRSIPQCRGWTDCDCARRETLDMTMILAIWCIFIVYLWWLWGTRSYSSSRDWWSNWTRGRAGNGVADCETIQ